MGSAVLVLEDDQDYCSMLVDTLVDSGLSARGVNSAPEAVALATREPFDLIISDVRMEGMDGLECLAALRKVRPQMKSIVITGYASEDAPTRAMQVQAEDYLYKPFGFGEFLTAVRRVLESGQEKEGYRGVLGSFLRRFKLEPSPDWEPLRDLAFQTYYLGIRSRKLSEAEGLSVWDELERVSLGTLSPSELVLEYRCIIDRIAALARTQLYGSRSRKPGQVEPSAFRVLFERISQGKVSVEQLKLAPYVRTSGEADELARALWG
ncbi:MAG: response regulator [Candidatus Eremiobacterota bacterium]